MTKQHHNKKQFSSAKQPLNTAFADKLRNYKVHHNTGPVRLTSLKGDGIDHINIYQSPKTILGQKLSPFNESSFVIPLHGKFNSRQGLYYYLLSSDGDETYRHMNSSSIHSYAWVSNNTQPYYPNLRYFMAQALVAQIKNDNELIDLIYRNDLPFEAYYVKKFMVDGTNNAVPIRPKSSHWMVDVMNAISKAIKNDEELDLSVFVENPEELKNLQEKIVTKKKPKKKKPKQKSDLRAESSSFTHADKTEDNSTENNNVETTSENNVEQRSYFDASGIDSNTGLLSPETEKCLTAFSSFYDTQTQLKIELDSAVDGGILHYFLNSDKLSTDLGIGNVIGYANKNLNVNLREPMTIEDFRLFIKTSPNSLLGTPTDKILMEVNNGGVEQVIKSMEDSALEVIGTNDITLVKPIVKILEERKKIQEEVFSQIEKNTNSIESQEGDSKDLISIERKTDGELYFSEKKEDTLQEPENVESKSESVKTSEDKTDVSSSKENKPSNITESF